MASVLWRRGCLLFRRSLQGRVALQHLPWQRSVTWLMRQQPLQVGEGWGNPKQPMKLQQPRNYDFWMFQFNLLGSQGNNSREMTSSPPGHYWEVTVALTTAAKLQKSEPTAVKWQVRNSTRSMRFCVVSWLLSFQVPLGILWEGNYQSAAKRLKKYR